MERASEVLLRLHLKRNYSGRKAPYKMFTARAASSTIVVSEIIDCTIINPFAQRDSTPVSAGDRAVLVLKARNR